VRKGKGETPSETQDGKATAEEKRKWADCDSEFTKGLHDVRRIRRETQGNRF